MAAPCPRNGRHSEPDWDRTNRLKDMTEGNGRPRGGFFAAVGQDSQCQFPTAKCLPVATTPLQVVDFARPHDLTAQETNRE